MNSVKRLAAPPVHIFPGFSFSTCSGGNEDDQDVVTVLEVTTSHALLESAGEWNGWRPLDLVLSAIHEASVWRPLRT